MAYGWTSRLHTVTDDLLRKAHESELRGTVVRSDPVFVLGFWRSGTTFLHELLAADSRYRSPTTDQCMNVTNLLAGAASTARQKVAVRPMDSVRITSDSPQEDEFALLTLGAPSIYRAFLAPTLLRDPLPLLLLRDPVAAQTRAWTAVFLDLLRRLQRIDDRPLLLKSPTHSFRVRVLSQLLPDSRFVLVHRHPTDLWNSNVRMWTVMNQLYGLARLEPVDLHSFLRTAIGAFVSEVRWMRANLPAERYQEIGYETLVADPIATLSAANASLGAFANGLASGAILDKSEHLRRSAPAPSGDASEPSAVPELVELAGLFGYAQRSRAA